MRIEPLYHLWDVSDVHDPIRISARPLSLVELKALCGGDLIKLKKSGFRYTMSSQERITFSNGHQKINNKSQE